MRGLVLTGLFFSLAVVALPTRSVRSEEPAAAVDHAAMLAEVMGALGDEGRCQQIFQQTIQPLAKAEKATFLRGLRSEREKRLVAYEAAYARAAAAHVPKYLATDGLGERARAAREKLAALAKLEFLPQSDADGAGGLRGEVAEAMTTLREAYLLGPEDLASAFPQMAEARTKMQNLLLVTDWVRMAAGLGATVFEEPLADAKFMGAARAAQKAGKTQDRQKNCRCGQEAEYRWIRYGIWHRKMAKPRESCQKKIGKMAEQLFFCKSESG